MNRPGMREVSRMLASKIDPLSAQILPTGVREAGEHRVGSVAGEAGKSMGIKLTGRKAGLWSDFAGGPSGDALDLIAHVFFRGEIWPAYTWALAWLGITGDAPPASPRQGALPRELAAKSQSSGRERTESARRVWREATGLSGSISEYYLQVIRGVMPPLGAPLRFHPECPRGRDKLPAMVALMTDPVTNEPCGIHRTFLKPDGSGKADVNPNKMMLGDAGMIRLSPDENVTYGLGVCEGIETGLAIMQHAGWEPIWAATSAVGILNFEPLQGIERLTIFCDHDAPKSNGKQPGLDAARECAQHWRDAGRQAAIQLPPIGLDWDDALKVTA